MGRKKINPHFTLIEAIRDTIHNSEPDIAEIADGSGVSTNYLYRMGIEGESGVNFPLAKLIPVMRSADNYAIIQTLCRLTGHLAIKEPRGCMSKAQRANLVADFQTDSAELVKMLLEFLEHPHEGKKIKLIKGLTKHLENTAAIRRTVQKENGQHDLFQEGN